MRTLSDLVRIVSQATERRRAYAADLVTRHAFINLGGLDPTRPEPLRLSLADLYVPLKGRRAHARGEEAGRFHAGGRSLADREVHGRFGRPEPLLRLLRTHGGLMVLGDPGAGKTTFLRHLALSTACALLAERADLGLPPVCQRRRDMKLGRRLPLLVPLAAYAELAGRTPLEDYIPRYFDKSKLFPFPTGRMVADALAAGTALVLLDGVDEAGGADLRKTVLERVTDFHRRHRGAGNLCVVTSRIDGYRETGNAVSGLVECTVLDFDEADRTAFVRAFERATRGAGAASRAVARWQREQLLETIRTNEGVRRLAVNPLMLTVLALFTRQGTPLPERRVELYELLAEGFVTHWRNQRRLGGAAGRPAGRYARGDGRVRAALEAVAIRLQETGGSRGLVNLGAVESAVQPLFERRRRADLAAKQFVRALRSEVGILTQRGAGEFGFLHLTLQEYLAASGLVGRALDPQRGRGQTSGPATRIADMLAPRLADPAWREVILLAIGQLGVIRGSRELAGELAAMLIDRGQRQDDVPPGRAAALVGEAVADAQPDGVAEPWKGQVVAAALEAMTASQVDPRERVACGDALARLGDPRFHGPERWCLPDDRACGKEEDRFGFTRVERGDFIMGEDKEHDPEARDDEAPRHTVTLADDYWIARWPVTVAQLRVFVERTGINLGDSRALDGPANYPVVRVSWHEAVQYCEWLTRELREAAQTPGVAAVAAARGRLRWVCEGRAAAE